MSFEKEKWEHLISAHPGDFRFRGKLLGLFPLALEVFDRRARGRWTLADFEVLVSVNEDASYAAISFLPHPARSGNGSPAGAANGSTRRRTAMTCVYRIADRALVETRFMR